MFWFVLSTTDCVRLNLIAKFKAKAKSSSIFFSRLGPSYNESGTASSLEPPTDGSRLTTVQTLCCIIFYGTATFLMGAIVSTVFVNMQWKELIQREYGELKPDGGAPEQGAVRAQDDQLAIYVSTRPPYKPTHQRFRAFHRTTVPPDYDEAEGEDMNADEAEGRDQGENPEEEAPPEEDELPMDEPTTKGKDFRGILPPQKDDVTGPRVPSRKGKSRGRKSLYVRRPGAKPRLRQRGGRIPKTFGRIVGDGSDSIKIRVGQG